MTAIHMAMGIPMGTDIIMATVITVTGAIDDLKNEDLGPILCWRSA